MRVLAWAAVLLVGCATASTERAPLAAQTRAAPQPPVKDLRLGYESLACLTGKTMQEIARVRKEEDLRRQSGERLERRRFPLSDDEFHELNEHAWHRLIEIGQSRTDCGRLEVIDVSECLQAHMDKTESPSCAVRFVQGAMDALRAELVAIASD
jgi:hypothetical protein